MDSDALYIVARQGAVFCGEVVQHLLSVGTDEVGSVALSSNPFTVGCVDGDAANRDIVEQIVGKSAAIVAVYLNLCELEVGVEDLRDILDDKEAGRCTYPYQTIQILAETVELVWCVGRAILVRDGLVHDNLVVFVSFRSLRVKAVDAFQLNASAGDELDATAVVQDFVY